MCLMRKSVHCLTNKLFMAMDEDDEASTVDEVDIVLDEDVLVVLLTGRV